MISVPINMKLLIVALVLFVGTVSAQWLDEDFLHPVIKEHELDVRFYLHTRNIDDEGIELNENNLDRVDKENSVKIIVHGWLSSIKQDCIKGITDVYLYKDAYSVIQVDWSDTSYQPYFFAAASCLPIGNRIGKLIVNLHQKYGVPLSNFHLIGHSLGAHLAGYAGREVVNLTGSRISRISALDAASPLFESEGLLTSEGLERFVKSTAVKDNPLMTNEIKALIESPTFKSFQLLVYDGLKQTDADVVDAIHTDACEVGYRTRLGTVDFYPNGGTPIQPGCPPCPSKATLLDILRISKIKHCLSCSHYKSCWYFIDSINNGNFVSTKCSSWNKYKYGACNNNSKILMGDGYIYSPEATGKFYLRTNPEAPYAQDE